MTGMTTWERWKAGLPPRDRDERERYREYDAIAAPQPGGDWVDVSYGPGNPCPYESCHHNQPATGGAS